ncbi:hypothetical protein ACIRST_41500 [Kitasatospora sp. NPDC101447]|uniref:hypothetical protein n=1 Tax=Kitasatospora sp. NPDC101447 TaxID=3364102 RepID=UPI003810F11E
MKRRPAVRSRHRRSGAALLLLAAAGCTSTPTGALAPQQPVATPTVAAGTAELHLPVEAYMLSPTQSAQFNWVQQAATGACMKRYGQDYPVPARPDRTPAGAFETMKRRYGISDADETHRWGYHLPETADPHRTAPIGKLPLDAQTVLTGVDPRTRNRVSSFAGKPLPEHGCLTELDRILPAAAAGPLGPGNGEEGIVATLKAKSFEDSQADPRVTAAIAASDHSPVRRLHCAPRRSTPRFHRATPCCGSCAPGGSGSQHPIPTEGPP